MIFVYKETLRDAIKKPFPALSTIMGDKKITSKKMLTIKSQLERKYQKIVNKYFNIQQQENASKAFQDTYKDF